MDETRIYTLFIKYTANRLSASEYAELKAWLEASEANREQFVAYLRLHKRALQHESLERFDADEAWQRRTRRLRFTRARRQLVRWAVAAVVAGCCWLGYDYFTPAEEPVATLADLFPNHGHKRALFMSDTGQAWSQVDSVFTWLDPSEAASRTSDFQKRKFAWNPKGKRANEVHVPRGGEYSLVLVDGTKVWLNAASTLSFSYPFDSLRTVHLEGEAYFEVAHDSKPFEVHAAGQVVRVLGTKFNVRAYDGAAFQVTLAEGRVQVSGVEGFEQLSPDEQLSLTSERPHYEVQLVDAGLFTAWTRGVFEFDNTPLREIVRQLERWYDVDMTYASEDLKDICFTGSILRSESLGYALEMIQKVSDVRFSKQGDGVMIERK